MNETVTLKRMEWRCETGESGRLAFGKELRAKEVPYEPSLRPLAVTVPAYDFFERLPGPWLRPGNGVANGHREQDPRIVWYGKDVP